MRCWAARQLYNSADLVLRLLHNPRYGFCTTHTALYAGCAAGKAALEYEQLPPGEAARRVMAVLRSIYEPRGVVVPAPIEVGFEGHASFAL